MLRYIKSFLLLLIAAGFLVFAVSNRQSVHLSLFPFPYSAELPEFLFAVLWFAAGVIAGGLTVHLQSAKSRRILKEEHKRLMVLENELKAVQAERRHSAAAGISLPPAST